MLLESWLPQILVLSHVIGEVHDIYPVLVIIVEFVDVVSKLLLVPEYSRGIPGHLVDLPSNLLLGFRFDVLLQLLCLTRCLPHVLQLLLQFHGVFGESVVLLNQLGDAESQIENPEH